MTDKGDRVVASEVVGLIPAAGQARRLAPLPGSKELLPLGFGASGGLKVVSRYLLEQFAEAGVRRAFVVLGQGKWDIPAYHGSGDELGLALAYALARSPHGVPHTLDSAHAFVKGGDALLGLPDILYPPSACAALLEAWRARPCDLLLGLFPALAPERSDLVRLLPGGAVGEILAGSEASDLRLSWGLAVWSAAFGELLHGWVRDDLARYPGPARPEAQLRAVFQAALEAGMKVDGLTLGVPFMDVGTPEGYRLALGTLL